ncbi:MAG: 3,4-dihydroxy-2-butanone-4-phosphate synthase [Cellvibrionales bacterium]|nr:3,4-dihydroxy-2-butanone-4-phosphate synthase [Cellvibrionales bacterium]
MKLNPIEELVADIRAGKMVVLMDDEDRENEGDLVMAATKVRPEDINFMATEARGLICLTLTRARCEQLNLTRMVNDNESVYGTNFTASIEAAEGVTTGISAADRARTVQVAVAPQAAPRDIVQPGHIFPIMAQPGGVLSRAGHTEAGCDLAKLAGLESAAVIVEIMNPDGSMARRPDLERFAAKHDLKIGTIEALIHYRLANETTVECIRTRKVQTLYGPFTLKTYQDTACNQYHHTLVCGDIRTPEPVLCRVHLPTPLRDIFGLIDPQGPRNWDVHSALQYIAAEGRGIMVLLGQNNLATGAVERQLEHLFGEAEAVPVNANAQTMQVGVGSQILRDLGVRKMRLMSAPIKYTGIAGFDLEVAEYIQPPTRIQPR